MRKEPVVYYRQGVELGGVLKTRPSWQVEEVRKRVNPLTEKEKELLSNPILPNIKKLTFLDHTPKPCLSCGTMFSPHTYNQIYCSVRCSWKYLIRKRREQRAKKRGSKACPVCGAIFNLMTMRRKYCSPKCKNEDRRLRRQGFLSLTPGKGLAPIPTREPKICRRCKKTYIPRQYNQVYCSLLCHHKDAGGRRKAKLGLVIP